MSQFSFDVLRIPSYRWLLLTRLFGTMGLQCQAIIVGWQIYSLTHNPFMLGLTGLTEAVPAIICALFAGHIVDISKPHRVYFFCYLALALNTLMLFLFAGGFISAAHSNLLPIIYACIFTSGMARSFIMPASYALLPQIVQRPLIPSAMAWQSSCFQIGAIAGPAIAGLVYGRYGPSIAWLLPVSMMSFSFVVLHFIDTSNNEYKREKREPAIQSIIAGWKFILQSRALLSVMALDMFAVLFGGAVSMLPAFADHVLHVGSEGLGALRAAPAIGAVITSVTLALRPMKVLSAKRLLTVVAGFGLCMIAFGLSHVFLLSMVFLALSGAFDSVSMVIRSTLMQLLTPDDMRGRVSSVNSMFIISSNEIGSFESGTAASLLGLVPSVIFGGIMTLFVVGFTAFISPGFRNTVVKTDETDK